MGDIDSRGSEKVTFEGGPGDSIVGAVLIRGAASEMEGVAAEYRYLIEVFGRKGADWDLAGQSLLHAGGRSYDRMDIRLPDGVTRVIFFDISEFYGKTSL